MVRIVKGDFWTNYETYEEVIKRCFTYLYFNRFPSQDPQGEKEAFHNLLVELNRLGVFDRFDCTRPYLAGKTLDYTFEKFLFKWTEHVLGNDYNERKKRTLRFRRISDVEKIHRDTYTCNTYSEIFSDEPVIDLDLLPPEEKEKETDLKVLRNKMSAKYPTVRNIPDMCSEKYKNPDDDIIADETWNQILSVCRDDEEREIVRKKKEGISAEDIGDAMGCSGAAICSTLVNINKRFKKRISLQAA
jgi:DNA-directed RNA polymerase specialized sigma24 family protein